MLLLKKKKYAAVTMEVRDGKEILTTELKGLDIVRRDWSEFAANAGKNILTKILSDCSADERVEFIHNKMEELSQALKVMMRKVYFKAAKINCEFIFRMEKFPCPLWLLLNN